MCFILLSIHQTALTHLRFCVCFPKSAMMYPLCYPFPQQNGLTGDYFKDLKPLNGKPLFQICKKNSTAPLKISPKTKL
jgi:hypothetical protein